MCPSSLIVQRIGEFCSGPCSPNNSLTAAGREHFPVVWMPPSYCSKMCWPTFSSFSCFFIPGEWLVFDVGDTKSGVDAMSEEAWRISGAMEVPENWSRLQSGTIGNLLPRSHGSNQMKASKPRLRIQNCPSSACQKGNGESFTLLPFRCLYIIPRGRQNMYIIFDIHIDIYIYIYIIHKYIYIHIHIYIYIYCPPLNWFDILLRFDACPCINRWSPVALRSIELL